MAKNIILPQNEEDILKIPVEKRIFMFWQTSEGADIPGYILLCLETFFKFYSDMCILFLNYDNLPILIGDEINLCQFSELSLPMQSDVLKIFFIYKYGGTFADVDMIYTCNCNLFSNPDHKKLYILGTRGEYVQLAYFSTNTKKHFLLFNALQLQLYKLSIINFIAPPPRKLNLPWDFVGNSIINPLMFEAENYFNDYLEYIPRESMYLEDKFDLHKKYNLPETKFGCYEKFYFSKDVNIPIDEVLAIPKYGIVILHNSWTPQNEYEFKKMTASEFLRQDIMLARIFKHLLGTDNIDETELINIPITKNITLTDNKFPKTFYEIELENKIEAFEIELKKLSDNYELLIENEKNKYKSKLNDIKQYYENSRSWKITKPLRKLKSIFTK